MSSYHKFIRKSIWRNEVLLKLDETFSEGPKLNLTITFKHGKNSKNDEKSFRGIEKCVLQEISAFLKVPHFFRVLFFSNLSFMVVKQGFVSYGTPSPYI